MRSVQTHPQKFILLEHDPTHQNTQPDAWTGFNIHTHSHIFPVVQSAVNMQHTSMHTCIHLRLCLLVAASHFVFVCLVKVGQRVSLACTGI